jgi:hypothetical protein
VNDVNVVRKWAGSISSDGINKYFFILNKAKHSLVVQIVDQVLKKKVTEQRDSGTFMNSVPELSVQGRMNPCPYICAFWNERLTQSS